METPSQESSHPRAASIGPHFVNRLTHDLRVPFAAVRSALYLLERHGQHVSGPREKKWLEAAGSSLSSFERLLRAVDIHVQTLTYNCPQAPSCDLHEVINSSLALAQDTNANQPAVFSWDPRVDLIQPFDGNMILTAVRQLLDNAMRHASVGKPPEIKVIGSGVAWEIAVINDGPVIPESERPKLFTPFFHSQSHLGEQGPGLGLSTAALAAAKAGCDLTYERVGPHSFFVLRPRPA